MPRNKYQKRIVNKEVLIGVFFDIEKAYDMMWMEGFLNENGENGI